MNEKQNQIPRLLIGIFLLLVIGIFLLGFFYYFSEKKRIKTEKQKELAVIAELKIDQIDRWRKERLDDGRVLLKNSLMAHGIKQFQKHSRSFWVRQEILAWMVSLMNNLNYSNVFLLDSKGRVMLVGGNEDEMLGGQVQAMIPVATQAREVVITNLFQDEFNKNIHMDLLIPILDPEGSDATVIGLLVMRIDPYQVLYPLLQSWPVPSRTSESLLLRPEGKEYLCLNVLRHQKQTPFVLRMPLKTFQRPLTRALPFSEGMFEFVDYRSQLVLSSIHKIPNSSWLLLTKTDTQEIFEPLAEKRGMIIILVCLSVIVVGTSLGLYWRHQRSLFYRQKYEKELERERAEKALQEKELRYRTLFNIAQEGILIIKGEIIRDCNPAAEHLLASSRQEILGKNFFQFSPQLQPDGRPSIEKGAEIVGKAIHQGPQRYEWVHQTPDGNKLDVEVSLSRFYIEGESHLLVLERDITQRKRTEGEVQRLAAVVRKTSELVNLARPDGRMIFLNEAGSSMLGIDPEQVPQVNILEVIPDHLQTLVQMELLPALMRREAWEGDLQYRNLKTGVLIDVHTLAFTIIDPVTGDLLYLANISQDISERKRGEGERRQLEERLQRAEKMEALGTLAGGVAHDLNNVLGVLVGYSELLMLDTPEGSSYRDHAGNILQAGQRASAIIQDLLTLARRGVTVSKTINLNRIISDFLKTPEFERLKSFHPKVTFREELAPELLNINGSPIHLDKTVMNLLSNGAEAVSGPGEVVIRTETRYIDKPLPGYEETREGEYVLLMVSDTGMGIPVADLRRIFEPFYTKKVMGRSGTGLGLAVVWGTVKDHNGYIDVQSEEGKGSTFTLYFPVTRESLTEDRASLSRSEYIGRGESILVVDDVKEQRSLAATMLHNLGYQVATVPSGEEALEYLKAHQVDLLVLDMIMDPGLDGLETYQAILTIRPGQRAIIVSGYSETDRIRKAQALGAGAYVRKPYLLEKIGLAVRQELDKGHLQKS